MSFFIFALAQLFIFPHDWSNVLNELNQRTSSPKLELNEGYLRLIKKMVGMLCASPGNALYARSLLHLPSYLEGVYMRKQDPALSTRIIFFSKGRPYPKIGLNRSS